MSTLTTPPVSTLLQHLFADAEQTDRPVLERLRAEAAGRGLADVAKDYRSFFSRMSGVYLPVSPEVGNLLYISTRSRSAKLVVEFGLSFGISAIHLAAALRDNGGGRLISTELEATKVARARKNLEDAGLADLVDIREGDALETLKEGIDGDIDVLFLDGAKHLYLPVIKLLEPKLPAGAVIVADNTDMVDMLGPYLDYVRTPANGYVSLALPLHGGTELSVRATKA